MNRALVAFAVVASLVSGCATMNSRHDDFSMRRDEQGSMQSRRDDVGLAHREERSANLLSQSQSPTHRVGGTSTASRR